VSQSSVPPERAGTGRGADERRFIVQVRALAPDYRPEDPAPAGFMKVVEASRLDAAVEEARRWIVADLRAVAEQPGRAAYFTAAADRVESLNLSSPQPPGEAAT
jgi:hypothetical protein